MEWDGERTRTGALVDRFKIHDREIEPHILKALTAAGFSLDITPGIERAGVFGEPVPSGSIITVYRAAQGADAYDKRGGGAGK